MATRWGLCGAGKISHDFSVAMKTLPPGDHQVFTTSSSCTGQSCWQSNTMMKCVFSLFLTDSSYCIEELRACQRVCQEARYSQGLRQLWGAGQRPRRWWVKSYKRSGCTGRDNGVLVLLFEAEPGTSVSSQTLCTWECCTQSTGESVCSSSTPGRTCCARNLSLWTPDRWKTSLLQPRETMSSWWR